LNKVFFRYPAAQLQHSGTPISQLFDSQHSWSALKAKSVWTCNFVDRRYFRWPKKPVETARQMVPAPGQRFTGIFRAKPVNRRATAYDRSGCLQHEAILDLEDFSIG
jgi:hypothetical protein